MTDTSGAYIPGHGTPTVILFGKHQPPVAQIIRTAMGIKGEPATPDDPAFGLVWSAILAHLDQPGSKLGKRLGSYLLIIHFSKRSGQNGRAYAEAWMLREETVHGGNA